MNGVPSGPWPSVPVVPSTVSVTRPPSTGLDVETVTGVESPVTSSTLFAAAWIASYTPPL
jgi:hypothetical protein